MRCLALLGVEIFGVYLGGKSGLIFAVEAGDGARKRTVVVRCFGLIEEMKCPCGSKACGVRPQALYPKST